jgi:hypothetical protein
VLRGFGHTRRYLYNACVWAWLLAIDLGVRPDASRVVVDELRECFDWVRAFPSQGANEVVRDVERAFANWVDPALAKGRPVYEKRGARLRCRRHRALPGVVRNATFSYSPPSGWEVSFGVAAREVVAPPNEMPGVGVDFGVACSAFCSDESSPRLLPPTLTPGEEQRLLGLERRKARQLAYAKKLDYKCPKLGSLHVPVDPWGTSRTCPSCTVRDPANRPGCGRAFACVHCGHHAHADKVAAIAIEMKSSTAHCRWTSGEQHGQAQAESRPPRRRRFREASSPGGTTPCRSCRKHSGVSSATEAPAFGPGRSHRQGMPGRGERFVQTGADSSGRLSAGARGRKEAPTGARLSPRLSWSTRRSAGRAGVSTPPT